MDDTGLHIPFSEYYYTPDEIREWRDKLIEIYDLLKVEGQNTKSKAMKEIGEIIKEMA